MGWFELGAFCSKVCELISAKGQETADGSATAAMVVRYRLDSAPVIVDVGGGYGGGVTIRLKDNGIEPVSFVASWESIEKTKDGSLSFANKRAEVWWKFREALDPDQPDGSENPATCLARLSSACTRGLCSGACCVAACATSISCAGHASVAHATKPKLTSYPDHSVGADQSPMT
jgi:hypothetical protein